MLVISCTKAYSMNYLLIYNDTPYIIFPTTEALYNLHSFEMSENYTKVLWHILQIGKFSLIIHIYNFHVKFNLVVTVTFAIKFLYKVINFLFMCLLLNMTTKINQLSI